MIDATRRRDERQVKPGGRVRRAAMLLSWTSLIALLIVSINVPCSAQLQLQQQSRSLPKPDYYNGFGLYYSADYKDAVRYYEREARGAFRVGQNRFLDSVCFQTMIGECHYHSGNYDAAMASYEDALSLYLAFNRSNWQARVQLPPTIQEDNFSVARANISWGTPRRTALIAKMPNTFQMLYGRLDAERAWVEGGPLDNAEIRKVDVAEIMRCAALAMHRRRVIKGPTCKYDPFTAELVRGLSVPGAGNGTLMGSFNGILLGIAQASAEDWRGATSTLTRSLQFNRGMDHILTPVGLVELSQIALMNEKLSDGANLALEASYSAAVWGQYDLVEESLSTGATIHLVKNRTPYPPLENAIRWAAGSRGKPRLMQASLTVRLAECLAEAGNVSGAANVLKQTASAVKRRSSLSTSVVSARAKYVSALLGFLEADLNGGLNDLAAALKQFQNGSLWLYRLNWANRLVANGSIRPLQADLMYSSILRDPVEADWLVDPMESMAFLTSNHVAAMEQWFDILIQRRKYSQALDVAELIRRHRFYNTLPLGGRLLAFRWVMNADEKAISDQAKTQRRRFLARNGQYKALSEQADVIQRDLLNLPLKAEYDSPDDRKQKKLVGSLAEVSLVQEAMLASFALRREPADLTFPPQRDLVEFQASMAASQLAISTIETASGYHVFFVTRNKVTFAGTGKSKAVKNGVSLLLRRLGALGSAADLKDLAEEEWKETAGKLKKQLFGDVDDKAWDQITDLVIIPDGLLWYMPFEVFQVGEEGQEKYLSEKVSIRYCPTLYLSMGNNVPRKEIKRTAVVTARLHPRGNIETTDAAMKELLKTLPEAKEFKAPFRLPSNYFAWLADVLVVWSEMETPRNILDLRPMQIDQAKIGTTLSSWMSLPWNGPEHIVLPGLDALGRSSSKATGAEMFMTTTGLMASGTRTILIPRWSVAGGNSLALTRIYTEQLSKMKPAEALRTAIAQAKELDFVPEAEPRVKNDKKLPPMKADAPFFWASYMVVEIPFAEPVDLKLVRGNRGLFQRPAPKPAAGDEKEKADEEAKPEAEKADGEAPKDDGEMAEGDLKPDGKKDVDAEPADKNEGNEKAEAKKADAPKVDDKMADDKKADDNNGK